MPLIGAVGAGGIGGAVGAGSGGIACLIQRLRARRGDATAASPSDSDEPADDDYKEKPE